MDNNSIIKNIEKARKENKKFAMIKGKLQFITDEEVLRLDKIADNHMLDEDTYYYGVSERNDLQGNTTAKQIEIFQFGYGR